MQTVTKGCVPLVHSSVYNEVLLLGINQVNSVQSYAMNVPYQRVAYDGV